ncbi:hypothetical protein [Nocardia tengchongensis]|uniref:hypothetical protein n=1 Tax=Nocardia tengchongensis TaxID=2055889 RepID=UPI0036C1AB69
MIANHAKKFFASSLIAGALVAALTVTAPSALASTGCQGNRGGDTHQTDQRGRYTHGEGTHGVFLPNGVGQLGCIPGSMARPCNSGR